MKSHTIVIAVHCKSQGVNLDDLLDLVESLPAVASAKDVACLDHTEEERRVQVEVLIPKSTRSS